MLCPSITRQLLLSTTRRKITNLPRKSRLNSLADCVKMIPQPHNYVHITQMSNTNSEQVAPLQYSVVREVGRLLDHYTLNSK